MTVNDQDVVVCLTKHYPGPVATRALWLWAGGRETALVYDPDPHLLWQNMWSLAKAAEDGDAGPVAILRQALWDYPGHPTYLNSLEAYIPPEPKYIQSAVQLLARRIIDLAPDFAPAQLWAAMTAVGSLPLYVAFAAATPAFQGQLAALADGGATADTDPDLAGAPDAAAPSLLEKQLELLAGHQFEPDVQVLADAMGAFHAGLPDAGSQRLNDRLAALNAELVNALDPLPENITALDQHVRPAIARIRSVVFDSQAACSRQAVRGLENQAAALAALIENNPAPDVAGMAIACRQALWATTAESERTDADDT